VWGGGPGERACKKAGKRDPQEKEVDRGGSEKHWNRGVGHEGQKGGGDWAENRYLITVEDKIHRKPKQEFDGA